MEAGATGRSVYAGLNRAPDAGAGPEGGAPVDVVVAGAVARDVTPDDPRGWRLGGAAAFAALTMARLGLRVLAFLGADADAAGADELGLLRDAGVQVRLLPVLHGPIFENREGERGRMQRILGLSDPMLPPIGAGLAAAAGARGWYLGPVAAELPDAWLDAIPPGAPVAVGWQGLLRTFSVDGSVARREPGPATLLTRATLVCASQDDLAPSVELRSLTALLEPRTTLVITHGADGGLVFDAVDSRGRRRIRRYDAIPSRHVVDLTGAGDTFAAALFAARLEPRLVGGRLGAGYDLLLAAAAASLVVEAGGLAGVPSRSAVRGRMRDGLALIAARRASGD